MITRKSRFGVDWSKAEGSPFWRRPQIGRRVFFRNIASAVGGYFLMPSRPMETIAKGAGTPIGTAKNCIFILLTGAPSHIDTFDLKEGAWTPSYFNPTSYGGIRFPQGLMPNIADQLDSIAFVRNLRAWNAAHTIAQTWVQIGRNPESGMSKIAPHIGSVVAMELAPSSRNRTLPRLISLDASSGPGEGYLSPENAPVYVSPDSATAFQYRWSMLCDVNAELSAGSAPGGSTGDVERFNHAAATLMYNTDVNKAFTFDRATRNLYGNSGFGNACLTARNLLKADMGTRFVQISFGSWDHHTNIYAANSNLQLMARQFDSGIGQLIRDLKNDGLLDHTLIVALGEFGRTVGALNTTNGRDHHVQHSALIAGAKVTGKRVIGVTDKTGASIVDPGWSRKRESRPEDIEATIYSALGIDWTTIRHDDSFKRGFEYVPSSSDDLYGPINELWS